MVRRLDRRGIETGVEDASVEWGVVGHQEVRAIDEIPKVRPYLTEGRTVTDIVPGQAVETRVDESFPRRADQPVKRAGDAPVSDPHHAHRAGAVAAVVGCLEVDGGEVGDGLLVLLCISELVLLAWRRPRWKTRAAILPQPAVLAAHATQIIGQNHRAFDY